MNTAFIGLGSNLGKRLEMIEQAIAQLSQLPHTTLLAVSSIYESPPIDGSKQNHFLNAVCKLKTDLPPTTLLEALKHIERNLGRPERYARWSPRPIDLDILFYDDLIFQQDDLTIPHAEIPNRKFVLLPMLELEDVLHPVLKKPISTLLAETIDRSLIVKTSSLILFNKKTQSLR
jgi:2-amino-4-hydroxy-6-hydroxymethyldihydropteridine diphosphokinase